MSKTKREIELEEALIALSRAGSVLLSESNGLTDNEWQFKGTNYECEFPFPSYLETLRKFDNAYTIARDLIDPIEAEKRTRWANACATASAIVDIFKADASHMATSSLHRNIADAIYGTFVVTMEERLSGKPLPPTMDDKLKKLVARGELIEVKPGDLK